MTWLQVLQLNIVPATVLAVLVAMLICFAIAALLNRWRTRRR